MPMPSTTAPRMPVASQIAEIAKSTLRMRLRRLERLICADPAPIDGVRRCRPPSRLSRNSARPSPISRSLSRVRSATRLLRRQQVRFIDLPTRLRLPFGASDVALGFLDLAAEQPDRLLHAIERLQLELI